LIVFFATAIRNRRLAEGAGRLSLGVWQLTFIRCYIGFDLVPHFTEKLFAGSGPRGEDVVAFTKLGVPIPEFFVILAGFCELGVAIGIGLGVLTRLAACGWALYFLIATILGHHFFLGFIWASPGGGWEYPVLMIALLLSFTVAGGGPFSIDAAVAGKLELPGWCLWLMGRR
jgi:putative oxidoreductase